MRSVMENVHNFTRKERILFETVWRLGLFYISSEKNCAIGVYFVLVAILPLFSFLITIPL
jgi:hypothetical protein